MTGDHVNACSSLVLRPVVDCYIAQASEEHDHGYSVQLYRGHLPFDLVGYIQLTVQLISIVHEE